MVGLHLNGISQPLIGIVVELKLEDFKAYAKYGALYGISKEYRAKAWHLAGETQRCQHNE
jgi:hypothetical protein